MKYIVIIFYALCVLVLPLVVFFIEIRRACRNFSYISTMRSRYRFMTKVLKEYFAHG